jgi:RNA polymerase sigma-70 factor (ECF subfamily)
MAPGIDADLVARLKAGDSSAFDAIHAAWNARLFTFLVRLSRRRDVAEDLLEETWLRLVTHASRLRPDTQLGPWLFTVARHLHTSYQRSRLVEQTHAHSFIGLWPFGAAQISPFEEAALNETGRRVEAALATLPLHYREVLLLTAVEGLRPQDAAAVCGLTPEALRQRLSRARALLTKRMTALPKSTVPVMTEVAL